MPGLPTPYASMGFVGNVVLSGIYPTPANASSNILVRVKDCNIQVKQAIEVEEVVDGRIDKTLYKVMPRMIEGDANFPLVHDVTTGNAEKCSANDACSSLAQTLWAISTARNDQGRMKHNFDVNIRYTDNTAFLYPECVIDNVSLDVTQGANVNMKFGVKGKGKKAAESGQEYILREDIGTGPYDAAADGILAPLRVVTWNDFRIQVSCRESAYGIELPGEYIRRFTVDVKNNIEPVYTFNTVLAPQDLAPKKRDISGSLELMGFSKRQFHDYIFTNHLRNTSMASIKFGYTLGSAASHIFASAVHGVIFKIEEVSVRNDLVTTAVNYIALGDCENSYEGIEAGKCNTTDSDFVGQTPGNFGGATAPNYFTPI